MSAARLQPIDRLRQYRLEARETLAASNPNPCQPVDGNLAWPTFVRSPWELQADSLAIARVVEDLTCWPYGVKGTTTLISAYLNDPGYRPRVDLRVTNWIRASNPAAVEGTRQELLFTCITDAKPSSLPDHSGQIKPLHEVNVMKEAVAILGGPAKAAQLVGVTVGTVKGWMYRGYFLGRKEAERLLKLAGVNFNPLRNVILV